MTAENGESETLTELRIKNRENERTRRWNRPQSGYFDYHPPRDDAQPDAAKDDA